MDQECRTLSVPDAGKLLGLGRNASYEAAARGQIPTIRFGRLLRVPVRALDRLLDAVGPKTEAA
jgi:excisionase family DNA binding protein